MQRKARDPSFEQRMQTYDAACQSGDGFARSHDDSSHFVISDVGEENHGHTTMEEDGEMLLHHHHADEDGECIVECKDGINNLNV